MKSATIVGYHGRKNLGDDLFLRLGCQWLKDCFEIKNVFVAGFRTNIPSTVDDVSTRGYEIEGFPVRRFVWLQTFFYALRSNVLLFCAGSIFVVQPFFLAFIILKALRVLRPRLAVVAIGVSIGPFSRNRDRYWCSKLLQQFHHIVLRDKESFDLITEIGGEVNFTLGYDLALTLQVTVGSGTAADKGRNQNDIAVCLNNQAATAVPEGENKKALDIFAESIAAFHVLDPKREVCIVNVCADPLDGDLEVSLELDFKLRALGVKTRIDTYEGHSPEEFASLLGAYRAVITSRMHTGVLAMMQGVPVLQVGYARKIRDFYLHCGLGTDDLLAPEEVSVVGVKSFLAAATAGDKSGESQARCVALANAGRSMLDQIRVVGRSIAQGQALCD